MEVKYQSEDAISFLEAQLNQARYDLKENLLPKLKHGQKERLLLAMLNYPHKEEDFSEESEDLIKAFSAAKICIDTNVVLGVELVMEQMAREEIGKLQGDSND